MPSEHHAVVVLKNMNQQEDQQEVSPEQPEASELADLEFIRSEVNFSAVGAEKAVQLADLQLCNAMGAACGCSS
jgi:hypothetical protein